MADGVLDNRLEEKTRDNRVQSIRRDIHLHRQPVAEANLFNVQIMLKKLQLFFERHLLDAFLIQSQTEQNAQSGQHSVSRLCVVMSERRDAVQRVKKEMRLELGLSGLELNASQAALQSGRL